jgi:hypothetical protein
VDDGVIDYEDDDGDDHALEIESRDSGGTQCGKQETADNRANDSKDNVEDHASSRLVDDPARDETRDETEDQPRYY